MKKTLQWINTHPDLIPNLLAFSFLLILFFRAITSLDTYWDSLAYHLPFAGRLVGIFSKSEFLLSQQLEEYYDGFPKLGELLQGFFWRLTGRISATNLAALLSILLVNLVASLRLKLKFWMVTLVLFSVPLIVVHSTASYIDLIAGSFFCIGLINLLACVENNKFTPIEYSLASIPLALSANVKYQLTIIATPLLVLITLLFFLKMKKFIFTRENRKQLALFVLLILLVCMIAFGFMINNWIQFANPVYPIDAKLGPIHFKGGENSPYEYSAESTGLMDRFRLYLKSLSEVGLWTQPAPVLWTIDMSNNITADQTNFYKMGGYFVTNLALWSIIILAAILFGKDKKILLYSGILLLLFIVVGFMPSSHFLRYWLFLPILLGVLALFALDKQFSLQKPLKFVFTLIQVCIFAFVLYQTKEFIKPKNFSQEATTIQAYHLATDMEGVCISEDPPLGFLYKVSNMEMVVESEGNMESCELPVFEVGR